MNSIEFSKAWFDNVWNKGDVEHIKQFMSSDCYFTGLPPEHQGINGFITFHHQLTSTLKNITVKIVEILESDDRVIGTAVMTGNYFENGNNITMPFAFSGRVVNDQLVEANNIVDFLSLLQQAGKLDEDTLRSALA